MAKQAGEFPLREVQLSALLPETKGRAIQKTSPANPQQNSFCVPSFETSPSVLTFFSAIDPPCISLQSGGDTSPVLSTVREVVHRAFHDKGYSFEIKSVSYLMPESACGNRHFCGFSVTLSQGMEISACHTEAIIKEVLPTDICVAYVGLARGEPIAVLHVMWPNE